MTDAGQHDCAVRTDWGPTGALACAADLSVVVDVFSFSTSVTIATERGTSVYPYPWRDPSAQDYASRHGAVLAVGRLEAARATGPTPPSLSPSLLMTTRAVPRLVLPSPNGSTICSTLRDQGSQVAIGCLRNASAVAAHAAAFLRDGASVALVAAGERWDADDSLRPALEDLLGVGAVAAGLRRAGFGAAFSPETEAAAALFTGVADDLTGMLSSCVGGRELTARGFADDVRAASELDVSTAVPLLRGDAFIAAWA